MVAVGGFGFWSEPSRTCGQNIQRPATSLPPEVVPQLLCGLELRMARAQAGAAKPTSVSGLPSLPPSPFKIRSSETRNQTCLLGMMFKFRGRIVREFELGEKDVLL